MSVNWTEANKKYVADNSRYLTDKQIAARLNLLTGQPFTRQAVANMRKKVLRLAKLPGRGVHQLRPRPGK